MLDPLKAVLAGDQMAVSPFADEVITLAHEAALDPRRWPAVSDALSRAAGCICVHLVTFDTEVPGVEPHFASGYAPDMVQTFQQHYGALNPWRQGLIGRPEMSAATSEQMLPHAALVKTEFHADWLLPQGDISAGAAIILERRAGKVLVLGGHIRMRDQDRLERRWIALVREVGPFLRHALEINRALSTLRLDNLLLTHGLGSSEALVLALSADGRILVSNKAAGRCLSEGRILQSDARNRLRLSDEAAQQKLEAGLRRLRQTAAPLALPIPDAVMRCVRIGHLVRAGPEVLPFAGLDPLLPGYPDHVPVLVVAPPGAAPTAAETLMRRFGLTRAEAEVASGLHQGHTLREIAEARRSSIHTVRAQTKTILGKCGVRRQAELTGLIARAAGP